MNTGRSTTEPSRPAAPTPRRGRLWWLAVVAVLLADGCAAGSPGANLDGSAEAACAARFPRSYADGPELTRGEFTRTEVGRILDAFFVGGPGEPENGMFLEADGFSQVSPDLVLGYRHGLIASEYTLEGGRVAGWGTCQPVLVSGDLTAYRWQPVRPLDPQSRTVALEVDGGACVEGEDTEVITRIDSVDVVEYPDRVQIVVWARNTTGPTFCAGVGVWLDAEAHLTAPLGDRTLIDGGTIPPSPPAATGSG